MLAFQVKDMTCGHCAGAITKAVKRVDHAAEVAIDLARHLVTVTATASEAPHIREAIAAAGYSLRQRPQMLRRVPLNARRGRQKAEGRVSSRVR